MLNFWENCKKIKVNFESLVELLRKFRLNNLRNMLESSEETEKIKEFFSNTATGNWRLCKTNVLSLKTRRSK